MSDRRVVWRALLDIVNVKKNAREAEKELKNLEDREKSLGKTFQDTDKKVSESSNSQAKSVSRLGSILERTSNAYKQYGKNTTEYRDQLLSLKRAQDQAEVSSKKAEAAQARVAAAQHRAAAASEKNYVAQIKLADAQKKLTEAQKAYEVASKNSANNTKSLAQAAEDLEKAQLRVHRATALSEASSSSLARSQHQASAAASDAAQANDRLSTSLQRVHDRQVLVESSSANKFGRSNSRALRNIQDGYKGLIAYAAAFNDLLLIKTPAAIGVLGALGSAVSSLVAGFGALLGAIGPVVGVLGALPGMLAGGITAIGSIVLGFSGIGNALKAYSKDQKNAAKDAAQAAKQQRSSARQVRDAQRSLVEAQKSAARSARDNKRAVRDAYESAARSAESSADRIANAEEALARAQKDAQNAQKDLNRARADAIRQLEDMKKSVRDAGFSEEEAVIAVEEARKRLEKTRTSADSTDIDLRRADLDYREAVARLDDARKAKSDAISQNAEAQRKGVEGSDAVVAAQDRVIDSTKGVADAQEGLKDAQKESARAARDSAEAIQSALENQADAAASSAQQISRAQEALADSYVAQAEAAATASGANSAYAESLKNLSPAARKFVEYLVSLQDKFKKLKSTASSNLLPGVQRGLESLMTLFPMIERTVGNTAGIIGEAFAGLGKRIASPEISGALQRIFDSNETNLSTFLGGMENLVVYFTKVADAARPLAKYITDAFGAWAKGRSEVKTDEMEKFFEKTQTVLGSLGRIFGNLYSGFKGVGRAAWDFGKEILDRIEEVTGKWSDWVNSIEGQNELKQWFDDAKPGFFAISGLITDISKGFLDLATSDSLAPFIETLRTTVIPNLKKFFDILAGQDTVGGFTDLLVKISEALVKMAESGAMGGLKKVMEFLGFAVDAFGKFVSMPGVGVILSGLAAALTTFKLLRFGAAITGISTLYTGIKKLFSLRGRGGQGRQLAGEIAAISAATGQSPEQIGGAYGVNAGTGKKEKYKGKHRETKPSLLQRAKTRTGGGTKGTASLRGAGRLGGAAGAAGAALSMVAIEGPLGNILAIVSMLLGFLPMLMPLFGVLGGVIAAIGAPVIAIVAGIVALGAAIVLLWKNNEGFRNFVIGAWNAIKDAIVGAWNNYIFPALQAIGGFITDTLVPIFVNFWKNIIVPAFAAIGRAIAWAWNNVIKPVFSALWGFISEFLIPIVIWFAKNIVGTYFKYIWGIIQFAWNNVIKPVFEALWGFIKNTLGPIFTWLWNNVIKPVWGWISSNISDTWNNVIKPAFDALKRGVKFVGDAFATAKNAIATAWGDLVDAIKRPIDRALQWVQENLIDRINGLLTKIGISWQIGRIWTPQVSYSGSGRKSGKNAKMFNSGGMVPGSSPHDRADNIPAMLTAGEYVLPVRAVKTLSQQMGPGYLENLRQGKVGPRRYADGGFVRPVAGRPSFPWGRYPSGGVHRALDIPVPIGTPVVSAMNGKILAAGWDSSGFGNHIRLAYDNGQYMILGHLSQIGVSQGQRVRAGQMVGRSGNTGRSTGPHVHVEMRSSPYNPSSAFNFTNAWNTGKAPMGGFSSFLQGTMWSDMALGIFDTAVSPLKSLANATLGHMGLAGQLVLGAANGILGGIRNKVAEFFGQKTVNYDPTPLMQKNAPMDDMGGSILQFAVGGRVPGVGNKDTVPAMLTPGEFVLRKEAVQKIGLHNLRALNGSAREGGMRGGVGYFNLGGPVPRVGTSGYYTQGRTWGFMNLVRMALGLSYNSTSNKGSMWDSQVSSMLSRRGGYIPPLSPIMWANWSNAKKNKLLGYINGGGTTTSRQRDIFQAARYMRVTPTEIAAYVGNHYSAMVNRMTSSKRGKFLSTRKQVMSGYDIQVRDAQTAVRMGRTGKWTAELSQKLSHLLMHGATPQIKHSDSLPTPWPLTALQTAVQQQQAANTLQAEFNKAMDTLSSWGLGDLVSKLLDMGPQDGIGLAREAVKSRALATDYNSKLAANKQLVSTTSPESYQYVAYLNSAKTPGIRDSARQLGVPDYAVVQLFEQLLSAGRLSRTNPNLSRMIKEVSMFRRGIFYAATGGTVPGTGNGDTVPAMLTPGEFVLRKSAVRALGMENVQALNNVQYFADGGPVFQPNISRGPNISMDGMRGLAGRLLAQGSNVEVQINTKIYNPVAEPSSQSLNKMLRRRAAVGDFGQNPRVVVVEGQ